MTEPQIERLLAALERISDTLDELQAINGTIADTFRDITFETSNDARILRVATVTD